MEQTVKEKTTVLIEQLFQPGEKIEIELEDKYGNKRTYQSMAIRSINKNHLSLLISDKDMPITNFRSGSEISLTCFKQSKFVFISELVEIKAGEHPVLIVLRPTEIHYSSRRNYFRCVVNFPINFFNKQDQYKGEVIDLSVSGMRVRTDSRLDLQPDMLLTCKFVLPTTGRPILLVAKVIRIIKDGNFQEMGLNFQNPPRDIQTQITQYLFHHQRILINKNLKNKAT